MTNLALQDLREIFGNTTSQFPFDKFISTLDNLFVNGKSIPSLETRNKNGQIRKYKGEYYFSLKSGMNSGNVFFGGNENSPDGRRVPTIKIYKSNRMLQKLPIEFTFPSQDDRSPGRVSIILSQETISVLFDIMQEEIAEYNANHEKQILPNSEPLKKTQLMKKEEADDSSSEILFWVFLIIGVIIALISFFNLSLVGIIIGIVVFIIGCFFVPEQTKKGISFEEARYVILGRGNPPESHFDSNTTEQDQKIRCPQCHSSQITSQKRGFKIGRAIGAGLATGAIGGLIVGGAGKDKIILTCLKCKHQWNL